MQGKIHSRMATADANVLADGGVGSVSNAADETLAGEEKVSGAMDVEEPPRDEL